MLLVDLAVFAAEEACVKEVRAGVRVRAAVEDRPVAFAEADVWLRVAEDEAGPEVERRRWPEAA